MNVNNKLLPLIIVQCRFDSTRLPGKALFPLAGESMLSFLLHRIKSYEDVRDIPCVLATTSRDIDDLLAQTAQKTGIPVVRGETCDVLARYCRSLKRYPSDPIVRVTADNPLTCPDMLKKGLERFKETRPDYLIIEGLPYGAGVDIFSAETLFRLDEKELNASEREHINLNILNHPDEFKVDRFKIKGFANRPDIRITVDTIEDYERMACLFQGNEPEPWKISLETVIRTMDLHSEQVEKL